MDNKLATMIATKLSGVNRDEVMTIATIIKLQSDVSEASALTQIKEWIAANGGDAKKAIAKHEQQKQQKKERQFSVTGSENFEQQRSVQQSSRELEQAVQQSMLYTSALAKAAQNHLIQARASQDFEDMLQGSREPQNEVERQLRDVVWMATGGQEASFFDVTPEGDVTLDWNRLVPQNINPNLAIKNLPAIQSGGRSTIALLNAQAQDQ